MSDARAIKRLMARLERKKVALAKLRDEIREIESDADSMGQDMEEAMTGLADATDALSRLV